MTKGDTGMTSGMRMTIDKLSITISRSTQKKARV